MTRKAKPLSPRRKRMDRDARLQSARHWLRGFSGEHLVRSYAKWFGVDLMCALRELQALGVRIEPSYVAAVKRTFELRPSDKASRTAQAEAHLEELGHVRDEDFAYIAGRTGGGAAFGITTTEASEFEDSTFQARDDKAGPVEVKALANYRIWLRYDDGTEGRWTSPTWPDAVFSRHGTTRRSTGRFGSDLTGPSSGDPTSTCVQTRCTCD